MHVSHSSKVSIAECVYVRDIHVIKNECGMELHFLYAYNIFFFRSFVRSYVRYSNPTNLCLYIHLAMMNFKDDEHVGIYSFNIIRMDNGTNYMNCFFSFLVAPCKFLLLGKQFFFIYPLPLIR